MSRLRPVLGGRMPGRPPLGEAVQDLRREIGSDGVTTAPQAWSSFLRFGRRRYDKPGTPDCDGLLFQYGIVSFYGTEMFVLDFTRQFEVIDADGDHDHCALCYASDATLRNLDSFNSWFFHDSGEDLDEWSAPLADLEVWGVLHQLSPVDVRIEREAV